MAQETITLKDRFLRVQERINAAARAVGREPESVHLVVVTKGHALERIWEAIAAGASWLGENYVEEAAAKMVSLQAEHGLVWHMIGHVQRRKAQIVAERFDWVQSLDSRKLAEKLNHFAQMNQKVLPVLIEVNIGAEVSKSGFSAWDSDLWDGLVEEIAPIAAMNNLEIHGLMTIAPYLPDPELVRPYFSRMRKLRDYLGKKVPGSCWDELSMGMSADFEIAIQEGATIVRIGEAILGPRPPRSSQ